MFAKRKHSADARRVCDDWIAALPRDKMCVFEVIIQRWECAYAMMSVALDEAITLRTGGQLVCAQQQVSVAADLFGRLACALTTACATLANRSERTRELPVVEPLRSRFFRGNAAQSAASWNSILHHLVFGNRPRFFHKLRILSAMIRELDGQFCERARDICERLCIQPSDCWKTLDSLHYDMNTCLREAEIVLKSYLRALPAEDLSILAEEFDASATPKSLRLQPRLSRAPA